MLKYSFSPYEKGAFAGMKFDAGWCFHSLSINSFEKKFDAEVGGLYQYKDKTFG